MTYLLLLIIAFIAMPLPAFVCVFAALCLYLGQQPDETTPVQRQPGDVSLATYYLLAACVLAAVGVVLG